MCLSRVLRTPERVSSPDSPSLFSPGLLALSPVQALDWPQSLGRACGWAPEEATARPSDPGQTKDLRSLHKPPQVSLQRDVTESHLSGFRVWDPLGTPCRLRCLTENCLRNYSFHLLFVDFKLSPVKNFSPSKPLSHT